MSEPLEPGVLRLIDRWQRDFPLVERPYAAIAAAEGLTEDQLIATLARLSHQGVLSRVGATVRPNTAGASMLAAMRVPPDRLDEVAGIVNAEPGVNHNYEREHAFNLWFVLTGTTRSELDQALARIRERSRLAVLELPLERSYFIDLGFPLEGGCAGVEVARRRLAGAPSPAAGTIDAEDRRLLAALEPGLALVSEPFAGLARAAGLGVGETLGRLRRLQVASVVTRLGFIVRHRELGFRANAMSVWDVCDEDVDRIGDLFAAEPFVTLCYRRPRRLPDWPYNLFCMIHGRSRDIVSDQARALTELGGLASVRQEVLFSSRCFRQRGARLKAA